MKKRKETGLEFEVDKLTNSIENVKSGDTFPTEISLTASQLSTLFGAPIVAGDTYDISADVTLSDGTKYAAFPETGNAYASGIAAQPGSSTQIRYTAN